MIVNSYKPVDLNSWKRRAHFNAFRNYVEPNFCITTELDITDFLKKIRKSGLSFTFSLIFAVASCANEIEEFRYRIVEDKPVLFDKIDTAFTYIRDGEDLFKVVRVPLTGSLEEYAASAKQIAEKQKEYFTGPLGTDVFQFSPMPWISYKHISHTISGKGGGSTPLFDWGKWRETDGKFFLPFTIQVNHCLADGIHVALLLQKLEDYLQNVRL